MKPKLELGISNLPDASFKAFRLHQPAFRSHWHYHPELELVLFTKGRGMRFIGDDVSLYNEGDLFLIGKNLPHTFVSYESETPAQVEALCIQFSGTLFDSFVECAPLKSLFLEAERGIAFQNLAVDSIEKVRNIVSTTGLKGLLTLLDLLDSILAIPDRTSVLTQPYQRHAVLSDANTRIQTAIDHINTHYSRPIPVQEMAGICHFSPNAFCRWFKQHMGLTFVDYLNKVRLTNVCQLLLSTDYGIGQIALRTGFENISTLNRLFQQKLGTSPSKHREQHERILS
ncbi:AraC family transcriptional regulator [Spirosoma sp.]|uniref:helix-turn-helix domain-containing protein n=1 Tax=Spirosoma sp. TaxID=1899569 RepID=UPI002612CB6B|nr:AraC family transcriptional regulator [Spirosoma sp.]MCX6215307.1 AraC family transcriptional regulator [Spirosoma sp.]